MPYMIGDDGYPVWVDDTDPRMAADQGGPGQGGAAMAPGTTPAVGTPQTQDERAQSIQNEIVVPAYRDILGRDPDASELADGVDRYERFGGTDFRAWMQARTAGDGGPREAPASTGGESGGWFAQNAPSAGSDYGAPPAPFGERYTAGTFTPGTYTAPQWLESFTPLTMEQVKAEPGYQTRLDAGNLALDRGAASRGSVLSGGMLKARERYAQDYAANEYGAATGRAFDQYRQRYGEFGDSANRGFQAFNANEAGRLAGFTANEGGQLNQYNTRYKAYQDEIENTRQAERDRWGREMDLSQLGLSATLGGRP